MVGVSCAATNTFAIIELNSGWDCEYSGAIYGRCPTEESLNSLLVMQCQANQGDIAQVNPQLLERVLKVFRAAGEHPRIHVTTRQIYLYSCHIQAVVMPERV